MPEIPSPNFDQRPAGRGIDMLVLHYTGMKTARAALARMCDPAAQVSAHYLIDEDGTTTALVAEQNRAWHAGRAWWWGESDINGCSIGIELVNPGHEIGYRDFPAPQMAALEELAARIMARHAIPPERVLGHSDVAPERRQDPGERFDWRRLAAAGMGLWPGAIGAIELAPLGPGDIGIEVVKLQTALGRYGYRIDPTGVFNLQTETVVAAFQRHFRPGLIDGRVDGETWGLLDALLALSGPSLSTQEAS
jgi:N-acetylmuramoyl-L-alanine amidase